MGFFKTKDHDRELLEDFFRRQGLSEEALEQAVLSAKSEIGKGKPMAYITGEEAFFDLIFHVDENVLIPRPDTERLVEKAIALLPKGGSFIDLGTGSGCIAVTVLKHRPDALGVAMDIFPKALQVAAKNAKAQEVQGRLSLIEGDMLTSVPDGDPYDLVISNPPYIPHGDIAKYPSLAFEPQCALDGGEDGMDFYRAILKGYRTKLKKGGGFLFEIGFDQRDAITALGDALGYTCRVEKDYGGNDRVAILYPKNND